MITIESHFERLHNKTLKHPDLPCLKVGKLAHPTYFPLEVCNANPLSFSIQFLLVCIFILLVFSGLFAYFTSILQKILIVKQIQILPV